MINRLIAHRKKWQCSKWVILGFIWTDWTTESIEKHNIVAGCRTCYKPKCIYIVTDDCAVSSLLSVMLLHQIYTSQSTSLGRVRGQGSVLKSVKLWCWDSDVNYYGITGNFICIRLHNNVRTEFCDLQHSLPDGSPLCHWLGSHVNR